MMHTAAWNIRKEQHGRHWANVPDHNTEQMLEHRKTKKKVSEEMFVQARTGP